MLPGRIPLLSQVKLPPVGLNFVTNDQNINALTTQNLSLTITAQPFPTHLVVPIALAAAGSAVVASCSWNTIYTGSEQATVVNTAGTGVRLAIWIIPIPAGVSGTANLTVTLSAGGRFGRGVYRAFDLQSPVPTQILSNISNDPAATLNFTPQAGGAIICLSATTAGAARTHVWSNLTENYDASIGGGANISAHSAASASGLASAALAVTDARNLTATSFAVLGIALR
jgi:hypothetical protein